MSVSQAQSIIKPVIAYTEFEKLDIRVGTIVEASAQSWSKKLLRFTVDFGGELGKRVIFAGIQRWYTPDTFIGKQFCFLINLEPKKMGEEESQGMMIMADEEESPIVIPLSQQVPNGTIVR